MDINLNKKNCVQSRKDRIELYNNILMFEDDFNKFLKDNFIYESVYFIDKLWTYVDSFYFSLFECNNDEKDISFFVYNMFEMFKEYALTYEKKLLMFKKEYNEKVNESNYLFFIKIIIIWKMLNKLDELNLAFDDFFASDTLIEMFIDPILNKMNEKENVIDYIKSLEGTDLYNKLLLNETELMKNDETRKRQ